MSPVKIVLAQPVVAIPSQDIAICEVDAVALNVAVKLFSSTSTDTLALNPSLLTSSNSGLNLISPTQH